MIIYFIVFIAIVEASSAISITDNYLTQYVYNGVNCTNNPPHRNLWSLNKCINGGPDGFQYMDSTYQYGRQLISSFQNNVINLEVSYYNIPGCSGSPLLTVNISSDVTSCSTLQNNMKTSHKYYSTVPYVYKKPGFAMVKLFDSSYSCIKNNNIKVQYVDYFREDTCILDSSDNQLSATYHCDYSDETLTVKKYQNPLNCTGDYTEAIYSISTTGSNGYSIMSQCGYYALSSTLPVAAGYMRFSCLF